MRSIDNVDDDMQIYWDKAWAEAIKYKERMEKSGDKNSNDLH